MKNLIKKILRFQHIHFPLPLFLYKKLFELGFFHNFFYKYYTLCFDTDFNFKKKNTTEENQKYWLSKRSLYWHFAHLHKNRFSKRFNEIFKKHKNLFNEKRCCDLMSGLGAIYTINKINVKKIIFIEKNKFCCNFLKKSFPHSKVINKDWKYLKNISQKIDTLIMVSGCLIYLNEKDIEYFFKITKNIRNFILINDGTYLKDFTLWSGHNYWNIKTRLKKYNRFYRNSKIYTKEGSSIYRYFVMEGKAN